MSTKAPDVLRAPPSPMAALTLGEMHQARWRLIARCQRCGLAMRASLQLLIRIHGPDCMWWGHQPRCPGLACKDGRLTYFAQSITGGSWISLQTAPAQHYIDAWKAKRGSFHPAPR